MWAARPALMLGPTISLSLEVPARGKRDGLSCPPSPPSTQPAWARMRAASLPSDLSAQSLACRCPGQAARWAVPPPCPVPPGRLLKHLLQGAPTFPHAGSPKRVAHGAGSDVTTPQENACCWCRIVSCSSGRTRGGEWGVGEGLAGSGLHGPSHNQEIPVGTCRPSVDARFRRLCAPSYVPTSQPCRQRVLCSALMAFLPQEPASSA